MAGKMITEEKRELRILLLGKTGTGKSSTGNTIAGRNAFKKSGQATSVTDAIQGVWCETDRHIVKIIDGPGLVDTNLTDLKDNERAIENIGRVVMECGNGVNAFVYVLMYTQRFTKEDRNAVENLKKIIGHTMGDYSVVILTRGDEWREADENVGVDFDQWCKDNDKDYNGIFSLCSYRCVLFENRKPSDQQRATQINELVKYVESIGNKRGFYTNELFKEGERNREQFLTQKKAPQLKEKYQKSVDLLSGDISRIRDLPSNDEMIKGFREVERKAYNLLDLIEMEDKQSGALDELKKKVKEIITAAKNRNEACLKKLADEIESIQKSATIWGRILTGLRAALSAGGVVAAGAATAATGGLAFPLLIAATGAATAANAGATVFQIKKHKDDASTLEQKVNLFLGKK